MYVPNPLTIEIWASPIAVVGTDFITELDETFNAIVSDDAQSMVNHVNNELAKLPAYLTNELNSMHTESIKEVWNAEAKVMTANSYAMEPHGSFVKVYTSNSDGTFSSTPTTDYSALHYSAKAEASEISAKASEDAVASDLILTNADVVLTHADVVLTHADVVTTNADVVLTGLDVDATNADVVLTNADVVLTGLDVVATNADVVLTHADVVLTNADVVTTNTNATNSQLRAWEAEAEKMTADSYATEAEDVFVNSWASDGDGTFTATPTTEYSALHHSAKSATYDPSFYALLSGAVFSGHIEVPAGATGSQATRASEVLKSDVTTEAGSIKIENMVRISQANYNLLTPNASTMYVIVG